MGEKIPCTLFSDSISFAYPSVSDPLKCSALPKLLAQIPYAPETSPPPYLAREAEQQPRITPDVDTDE